MAEQLTVDPNFIHMLILKIRAVMAQEDAVVSDLGSNPIDDKGGASMLQDTPDNLSREVVVEEITGMDPMHQDELVALMWLGRDDAESEEWEQLCEQASERREVPTENYLLDHPLLAEHLSDGLEKLGYPG